MKPREILQKRKYSTKGKVMTFSEYLKKYIGQSCYFEKYGRGALLFFNLNDSEENSRSIEKLSHFLGFNSSQAYRAKITDIQDDFIVFESVSTCYSPDDVSVLQRHIMPLEDVSIKECDTESINKFIEKENNRSKIRLI